MEKFIRVVDKDNDHPTVYTAEEIADNVRGVGEWVWNGEKYLCTVCGALSRDGKRFCGYCGARNGWCMNAFIVARERFIGTPISTLRTTDLRARASSTNAPAETAGQA